MTERKEEETKGKEKVATLSSRLFWREARRRASSNIFSRALRFAFLPFVLARRALERKGGERGGRRRGRGGVVEEEAEDKDEE